MTGLLATVATDRLGVIVFVVLLTLLVARQSLQIAGASPRTCATLGAVAIPLVAVFVAAVAVRLIPLVS